VAGANQAVQFRYTLSMKEATIGASRIKVEIDSIDESNVYQPQDEIQVICKIDITDKKYRLRELDADWDINLDYYLKRTNDVKLSVDLTQETVQVRIESNWAMVGSGTRTVAENIKSVDVEVNYHGDLETDVLANTI
jgi:hypothetical protein